MYAHTYTTYAEVFHFAASERVTDEYEFYVYTLHATCFAPAVCFVLFSYTVSILLFFIRRPCKRFPSFFFFLTITNCSRDDTEMEYEILSNLASVWVLTQDDVKTTETHSDETLLSMEFSHQMKNTTLGLWNVNCAVTDFASYGYTWDVHECRTRILDASTTRCTCSRTGTFAILMTKKPDYVSLIRRRVRMAIIFCLVASGWLK